MRVWLLIAAAFGADSVAGRAEDAKGATSGLHGLRIVLEGILGPTLRQSKARKKDQR